MGQISAVVRTLLPWLALASLLSGCQSVPTTGAALSSSSSLLAVEVAFPVPLGRDPSLVQVYFVRGAIHGGLGELPDIVPATFVKWSRAYLLDPEPGTYSVVAVASAYAPPWNDYRIAGVNQTTWSRTSSDAMIFPVELIQQTRTTVGPGRVAFMGSLRVRQGQRINATTEFQDDLQRRIAERIRPGVASKSGFAGWLKRTRMVNLAETLLRNGAADRERFFEEAPVDLDNSTWSEFIARAAPAPGTVAKTRIHAPDPRRAAAPPESAVAKPPAATRAPEGATKALASGSPEPEAPPPTPIPTPIPEPQPFPGLPPDSPLSEILSGMSHHEVRKILGAPDGRVDRVTSKAWIPFYNGPGANLRDWIYDGKGRVVFSLYKARLEVIDVVYDPNEGK